MENTPKSAQNHILNHISKASDVLNYSLTEIRKRYSHMPICLMEYIEKGIKENVFEIRFDNENATLSCGFDDKKQCNIYYLFFNNPKIINDFTLNVNERYDYDFIQSRWILPNCYLKIKVFKDDTCFLFYRLKTS